MKGLWVVLALALVCLVAGQFDDEDDFGGEDVISLTKDNFREVLEANDYLFVWFYAPWCGHCKQMAPHMEKLAVEMAGKVAVAKVDGTEETDLMEEFGIQAFPQMRLFKFQARPPLEYGDNPRDEQSMRAWLEKMIGPPTVTLNSAKEYRQFLANNKKAAVGFFDYDDKDFIAAYKEFVAAAGHPNLLPIICGEVFDPDVADELGYKVNQVVFHRNFDEDEVLEGGYQHRDKIMDFIEEFSHPYVADAQTDWRRLLMRGLPMVMLAVNIEEDQETSNAELMAWYHSVARSYRKLFSFTFIAHDTGVYERLTGMDDVQYPALLLIKDQRFYPLNKSPTKENTVQFLERYLAGDAESIYRSQAIPETNEGPVIHVVGDTFEKIVMDPTKYVLIEYYAPWCGHCKQLEPIYEELAQYFENNDQVVIAKIDATENDNPIGVIKGFPTIQLFSVGDDQTPIPYDGERTLSAMKSFLKEHLSDDAGHDEL